MKNKYINRAHFTEKKFREVLKFFAADFSVSQISDLTHLSRVTINSLIQRIRQRIFTLTCEKNPLFLGDIEADESYFGARRARGRRGRGASNKIKVFGLLKREGKVYTEIVNDVSAKTLLGIIRGNMRKKRWLNNNSIVLYSIRDFEKGKVDILI